MFIEHDNTSPTQPAADDHREPLPGFLTDPTYARRTMAELRAEQRRNERNAALAMAGVLLLAVGYFVAAASAPVSPLADTIAGALATVIYLTAGLIIGMALRSTVERRKRSRR